MEIRKCEAVFLEADMRNFAQVMTLSAALMAMGCGGSDDNFNYGGFLPGVNPPVAVADAFQVLGNGVLTGSVTANDTLNGSAVTAFQNPGNAGGTVAISAAGALTYTPPLNAANVVDTFTYTLTNSAGTSTATVTVNIGARGLFVKNDVAVSGTGTQSNPFKTLAEAVTAANGVNGAQIALFRGDGTSTGMNTGFTLGTNQGIASVDPANPATITGPVNITSGSMIKDLRIVGTVGTAVNGTNSVGGGLSGVVIDGATARGVALTNSTGTFAVANSTIRNTGSHGIVASADGGNLVWAVGGSTFANVTGQDVYSNTSVSASQNVTVANSNSTGGALQFIFVDANTTGQVGLNMTNNTVIAAGTKVRGLSVDTDSTANFLGLITGNTISGCSDAGMRITPGGNSTAKARLTGNQVSGNQLNNSVNIFLIGAGNPFFGGIFQNNVGNQFNFTQGGGGGIFQIEQLALFNSPTSAGNNTGVADADANVQDVPAGSLGIPNP